MPRWLNRTSRGALAPACLLALWTTSAAASASAQPVFGDFNGDGYSDLAVGALYDDVGSAVSAGTVSVLYGSASGLSAAGAQLWHQDSPGLLDVAESSDNFGASLASGDFNNDGYSDLAVGVAQELINAQGFAEGAVQVLYGSAAGLTSAGNQFWHQDSPGVLGTTESFDAFGSALAVGDINRDGFSDVAVGVPGEDASLGAVNVLYGSAGGLSVAANQIWDSLPSGGFGFSLAIDDFDGDGFGDLAASAYTETVNGAQWAGTVRVAHGSGSGLDTAAPQLWHQDIVGVPGVVQQADRFGWSLATGDYDRDGYADLAIGVPLDAVGAVSQAGAVNVLYGSANGLSSVNSQIWHQDSPGILETAEVGDTLGRSVISADFNGDGYNDLAIGAAWEDISSQADAGAVNVLYGSPAGLSASADQVWHQNVASVVNTASEYDLFGYTLAAGDFNCDGRDDLAVGVALENTPNVADAGAVHVLPGSAAGLSAANDRLWHQDSPGIPGTAAAFNNFGSSLGSRSSTR